jgi:hypothetical protein
MTTKILFQCETCGGDVVSLAKEGRTKMFRPGVRLSVPSSFEIPTCLTCEETYLSDEQAESLEEALAPAFAEYVAKLIREAQRRSGVTARALERALGVTPTYLSHVRSGKPPSIQLVRLLQAFVLYPEEVHRHLAETDWSEPLCVPHTTRRVWDLTASCKVIPLRPVVYRQQGVEYPAQIRERIA